MPRHHPRRSALCGQRDQTAASPSAAIVRGPIIVKMSRMMPPDASRRPDRLDERRIEGRLPIAKRQPGVVADVDSARVSPTGSWQPVYLQSRMVQMHANPQKLQLLGPHRRKMPKSVRFGSRPMNGRCARIRRALMPTSVPNQGNGCSCRCERLHDGSRITRPSDPPSTASHACSGAANDVASSLQMRRHALMEPFGLAASQSSSPAGRSRTAPPVGFQATTTSGGARGLPSTMFPMGIDSTCPQPPHFVNGVSVCSTRMLMTNSQRC